MTRRRLDAELVRRGLAATTDEARAAVREGLVTVGGRRADKPATLVDAGVPVEIVTPTSSRFVSRGGDKLDAALDAFRIEVGGRQCLDAGASTGGFTDCLLRRGAAHVVAVDVGYGQLAWTLRTDERVTVLERTNVRDLTPAFLPYAPDLIVADLSFISLRLAIPALSRVAVEDASFVVLVKPQFEAEPAEVEGGGVVSEPAVWRRSIEGVVDACVDAALAPVGVIASPLVGPAGNIEFLLYAVGSRSANGSSGNRATAAHGARFALDDAIEAGRRLADAS